METKPPFNKLWFQAAAQTALFAHMVSPAVAQSDVSDYRYGYAMGLRASMTDYLSSEDAHKLAGQDPRYTLLWNTIDHRSPRDSREFYIGQGDGQTCVVKAAKRALPNFSFASSAKRLPAVNYGLDFCFRQMSLSAR